MDEPFVCLLLQYGVEFVENFFISTIQNKGIKNTCDFFGDAFYCRMMGQDKFSIATLALVPNIRKNLGICLRIFNR